MHLNEKMSRKYKNLELISLACWDEHRVRSLGAKELEDLLSDILLAGTKHWRVLPLVHKNLIAADLYDQLEGRYQFELKKITQKAVANDLAMKAQLKVVLNIFKEDNLPCILLKGAAFSSWLYDNRFPRGSRDIDLLVKKSDFNRAKKLLLKIMMPKEKDEGGPLHGLFEEAFVPKSGVGIVIDLHKSITYPDIFNIEEDSLWSRSVKHPSYGSDNIRTFSLEDHIIHQVIHCCRDCDFNRYSLVDFHYMIDLEGLDLNRLENLANKVGCKKALNLFLDNYRTIINESSLCESKDGLYSGLILSMGKNRLISSKLVYAVWMFYISDRKIGVFSLCIRYLQGFVKALAR